MSDVLKQDLSQKAEAPNLFMIELLFEEKPALVKAEDLEKAAREKFGDIDAVMTGDEMISFAVKKYTAHFEEGDIPPMAVLGQGLEFDSSTVSEFDRYQLWDVEDGSELLDRCKYKCFLSEMMGAAMECRERCELMMDWLECVLPLFPECKAVWVPSSGKLLAPGKVMKNSSERELRFVRNCVNARFFNIEGTEGDMIVDTLGNYAVGLPDVQVHFRGLDVDNVVYYAYNIANFLNLVGDTFHEGDTIDGLDEIGDISTEVQWDCRLEGSLIQPSRVVLDIAPGEYAVGTRH